VLAAEVDYRASGTEIGEVEDTEATLEYRQHLASDGAPSEDVAAGYCWRPGTELAEKVHDEVSA
jgi:hypothetical protein